MARLPNPKKLTHDQLIERWTNWRHYMADRHPGEEPRFDSFVGELKEHYREFTPELAEAESGVPRDRIVEGYRVARAGLMASL